MLELREKKEGSWTLIADHEKDMSPTAVQFMGILSKTGCHFADLSFPLPVSGRHNNGESSGAQYGDSPNFQ
jgi:hypothetical protein